MVVGLHTQDLKVGQHSPRYEQDRLLKNTAHICFEELRLGFSTEI
jgi:hypothetical protein